jgi:hypothetical protein
MAKVSYISIPPGLEAAYKKGLQPSDRFTFSSIRIKNLFLSRPRIKSLTIKSLLVSLAPIWQTFSPTVQGNWKTAGAASLLTGWRAFVSDTAARIRNGTSGYATPNDIYQAMVGEILISSPSTGLLIEQAHPLSYFVNKKIVGTRSQYSPAAVTEVFDLPLELQISYHTALTSTGAGSLARFYAIVYSSYQGLTLQTSLIIDFGLSDSWQRKTATLSSVKGQITAYSVFLEVYNCTGSCYFDNVAILHNSHNWARDPNCNNVSESFTKAFFQVARHWVAVNPNSGAGFRSVYYTP